MSSSLIAWNAASELAAPLIIIGAGRSGSTLLMRLLDSHPEISMRGETRFLTSRLWQQFWDDDFWRLWRDYVATEPTSSKGDLPVLSDDDRLMLEQRVGRMVAASVADVLDIDPAARHWGFKEVWNGAARQERDWRPYDAVFPDARWIHLVRHPFDFVGSCIAWNEQEANPKIMRNILRDWYAVLACARKRKSTGRWHELRYEDLTESTHETLSALSNEIAIDVTQFDLDMMHDRLLHSKRDRSRERVMLRETEIPPGVEEAAASLGYDLEGWLRD